MPGPRAGVVIFIKINLNYVIFIKISDMLDFYKNQGGCPAPWRPCTDFYKFQNRYNGFL